MTTRMWLAGVLVCMALPVAAETKREESCRITTGIVSSAIEARLAGKSSDTVKKELSASGGEVTGVFVETVPPLVDMVFAFQDADLTPETAEAYSQQCLSF